MSTAVEAIRAKKAELEHGLISVDQAIQNLQAEKRSRRDMLDVVEYCLQAIERDHADPGVECAEEPIAEDSADWSDYKNVTRVTPDSPEFAEHHARASALHHARERALDALAPRASKRAPRRPVRQLVLEAIRKTKTDGTTVEALYLVLPSYRRRLVDSAVAHWIAKGNVVEAVGWLYCHGFEPEVVKALAAQAQPPAVIPALVAQEPFVLDALPEADRVAEPPPSGSSMRQRLLEFVAGRGGTSTMQEIMAAGLDAAEVYRAEREGKIEAIDIRGTYALVLEGEEAQAAQ